MRVVLAVTADFANLTTDNKLNILGIFTEINPPQLPYVLPLLIVVLSFEADVSDYGKDRRVALVLRSPGEREMVPATRAAWSVPRPSGSSAKVGANFITGWSNVVFQEPGAHRVAVFLEGTEIGSIRLTVNPPRGG